MRPRDLHDPAGLVAIVTGGGLERPGRAGRARCRVLAFAAEPVVVSPPE